MAENIRGTGPRPIVRRFHQLVDALDRARARYAICGATAMGAHGVERFTKDIDLLVGAEDLDRVVAELAPAMRELGRGPVGGPPKQVRLRSKRAKTDAGVDIDLMVPIDAVEAWALATSVRARAFERKIDVASAEALVVMKLRAYLSDPDSSRGAQHRADAMSLCEKARIDIHGVRRFVRSSPELADALEKLLAAPKPRGRLGELRQHPPKKNK